MIERLKTLPLTVVLTILIWMYAEAEFTSTQDNVAVTVQILSAEPNQFTVRALDKGSPVRILNLQLTLQGAKGQIEKILQQSRAPLGTDAALKPLEIPLDAARLAATGNVVSMTAQLNGLPYFRDKGVTVVASVPDRVQIESDKLVQMSRPLEKLNRNGVPVTVKKFEPAMVTITAPAKLIAALGGEAGMNVAAEPQQRLTGGDVGVERKVPVRLICEYKGEPDDRVTVTPQDAVCTLTVNAQFSEHFKPVQALPVLVTGPVDVVSPYRIQVAPKEVSVAVTGTPETISKLRAAMAGGSGAVPEETVRAYLDLVPTDKPTAGMVSRKLRYVLPEGVSLDTKVDRVEFRLSEMEPATRP